LGDQQLSTHNKWVKVQRLSFWGVLVVYYWETVAIFKLKII